MIITTSYRKNPLILEKVYELSNKYNLKDERIVVIGENTYYWYVSYMALLCGTGIAVPVDKELPENEIINVVKRSEASAIIYSNKFNK